MSENYEWQGLEEGQHNILACKDCSKPLVDIWANRPKPGYKFRYQAPCPFCGGQSNEAVIEGLVYIGSVEGTKLGDIKTEPGQGTELGKAIVIVRKE